MRDDICTIPVSEIFEHETGCPICRMRDMLQSRIIEYILGAAMMEPDVRQATNETGFCREHLKIMMNGKNRLGLALMLKTRLDELERKAFAKPTLRIKPAKQQYGMARIEQDCFVCDKIQWGMERLVDTMLRTYAGEQDFRLLFRRQEYICMPHYRMLADYSRGKMDKKALADFQKDLRAKTDDYLHSLSVDVERFTKMFDYRSSQENGVSDGVKNSIERAYAFLAGEVEQ